MNNSDSTLSAIVGAVLDNILTRTSVRQFTDAPVPEAMRQVLLRAAMSAPTGVNRQPWEFIVLDSSDTKVRLSEALPYAKMTAGAPIAIMVCGNTERFLDGDDSTLWVQDLSAASENILLAAHALGLGGVWTCLYPHPDRMEAAKQILGLPDRFIPFNLIPIGYPADAQKPKNKWNEDRIHLNGI